MKEDSLPGVSRRDVLGLIGATAALSLACDLQGESPEASGSSRPSPVTTPACVVRPQQTGGPYFIDERLNRSDIRSDPADGAISPGAPLRLLFRVSRIDGNSCTPLEGALVDVWQCDALGIYSDVRDFNGLFDTRGKKFLRGNQTTDASGTARFMTIYPGWYEGRTVHVHFKIRTDPASRRGLEFTSQLYFDDAMTDQVHAQPPYASKRGRRTLNAGDGIFRRGGSDLMLPVAKQGEGYVGTFDIGLRVS
ncbi:MAG TPA: intradiol ring-cleavage dioxygenase [Thermoanaerobaculia bacterium]|nr:intradiol ring-cleavage dioxygenase [Thermoanaerobaculia bacterium]